MRVTEPYTLFKRTLKTGKVVYYYQFRDADGCRSNPKSTGCSTLSQAKRFCQKLYNDGFFRQFSSLNFEVFTRDFFSHESEYYRWKIVNKDNITDETLLAYRKLLRYQLLPFFSSFSLKDITRSDVKQWIIWCSSKWSAKTTNNAQTVMNIIMNQAVDKQLIDFNPLSNLKFRKVEKKKREILTKTEIKEIYNSGLWKCEMCREVFLVAAITGMRISEIVALTDNDVSENYINVAHSYSRYFGIGDTKTHTSRFVPKPKSLILHSGNDFIFQDMDKPLGISKLYHAFMSVCDKLKIDCKSRNVTLHTLRNFFISYLQSENVSEPKIRAIVGHKDSSMTGLYTYWTPEMFPEIYEAQEKLYHEITE